MSNKPQILKTIDGLILPIKLFFSWQVPFMAKFIPTIIFLIYAILPTDFIADFIPVIGVIDDAAVFTTCAYLLVQMTPDDIIRKFDTNSPAKKPQTKSEKVIDIKVKK